MDSPGTGRPKTRPSLYMPLPSSICAKPLPDSWRLWLRQNLSGGCSPLALFDRVLEHGFRKEDFLEEVTAPKFGPYLSEVILEGFELQAEMDSAKKNRARVDQQIRYCMQIRSTRHLGALVQHANFRMEVPLCVLLALKKHPNNEVLHIEACEALRSLLSTSCFDNVFKLGGANALTSFVGQDSITTEAKNLLLWEIGRNSGKLKKEEAFQKLCNAGFNQAVLHALRKHPNEANMHLTGATVLRGLVPFYRGEEEKILDNTTDVLVSAIYRFSSRGGNQNTSNSNNIQSAIPTVAATLSAFQQQPPPNGRMPATITVSRCCAALHRIMKKYPGTIDSVEKAGGSQKILSMMENHPNDAKLQTSGSIVLCNFVDIKHVQYVCWSRAISALKAHPCHSDVQKHAMFLFKKIYSRQYGSEYEAKKAALFIQNSGIVPHIFMMMNKSTSVLVQRVGCGIVADLANWIETRNAVISNEAAYCVARSLKLSHTISPPWFGQRYFYTTVVQALDQLFFWGDSDTIVNSLMKEGGFQGAFAAMRHHVIDPKYSDKCRVCEMLLRLASFVREDVKLEIACRGGAEVMLAAMKQNPDDREIQRICCKALGMLTILKSPSIFEPLAKADGLDIIMDAIEKFPYAKDKDIFNYGGSAALLVREFENEQKANSRRGNN